MANTTAVFPGLGDIQSIICGTAAQTAIAGDLTVANVYLGFTAVAGSGNWLIKLVFRSLGTNVPTVCRVWINNGSALGTAANNTLYKEITLPATTVSQVAALADQELPIGIKLPAGYKVYYTFGTATAAGFNATAISESLVAV